MLIGKPKRHRRLGLLQHKRNGQAGFGMRPSLLQGVQLVSADASIHDVDIWFRKNGSDVTESNSQFSVPSKHGAINGHLLGALNFYIDLAAGDNVEIMWSTSSSNATIQYIGPQTSPTRPGTPSAIVTMALAAPPQLQGTYT